MKNVVTCFTRNLIYYFQFWTAPDRSWFGYPLSLELSNFELIILSKPKLSHRIAAATTDTV